MFNYVNAIRIATHSMCELVNVGQNKETSSMNLVQQNFLSNLLQVRTLTVAFGCELMSPIPSIPSAFFEDQTPL